MTEQEYRVQLSELEKQFNIAKKDLKIKYVKANVKFKKGDIIRHKNAGLVIQVMLVNFMAQTFSSDLPTVRYEGYGLKADLTPKKNAKYYDIYQDYAELVKKA